VKGAPQRLLGQGRNTARELTDMLEWIWLAELLAPGEELCLLAPLIDNAPLLDNSTGAFDALDPGWGRRSVRLLDLVLRIAASGQRVVLGTLRAESQPLDFLGDLRTSVQDHGLENLVQVYELPWLSASGLLTSHGLLRGDLEFSYDAVRLAGASASFDVDPKVLQAARASFLDSLATGVQR
jgi:hypothetical protein